jgi:DNA polymerase III delta prime subunit
MNNNDQFLWVEKFRPKTIDECILPANLKNTFNQFAKSESLPNMILSGGPGVGKTTVARALCEMSGVDYIVINGSEESGIDVLRTKIKQFASTVSFTSSRKMVILDEADYLNPQSTQPAMRGFIEEFSGNCGFIFTCNFKNRIIEPIHSRCSVFDFKITNGDKAKLASRFMKRAMDILEEENVKYDKQVVAELITKHFPDYRRVLNELQRYSVSGTIDTGVLVQIADINLGELMAALKDKNFKEMRSWVALNVDNDPQKIYRKIYDTLYDYLKPTAIPQTVITLADYQYKSAFAADQELNLVACLTELMVEGEFK